MCCKIKALYLCSLLLFIIPINIDNLCGAYFCFCMGDGELLIRIWVITFESSICFSGKQIICFTKFSLLIKMLKKKFVFSSHKAHKVGADLRCLRRLADRWLPPPTPFCIGCQSIAGNFSNKTGTHLHLGTVRKWRLIIFPKD